jgi:hypothetical protein
MGLLQDADEAMRHAKEEAEREKIKEEAAAKAKEEAKKEQQRHEANKRQGMI